MCMESEKDEMHLKYNGAERNEMNKVVQYLDTLVTTINPSLNVPLPDRIHVKKG